MGTSRTDSSSRALAEELTLPCPAPEQRVAALDTPGRGRPTPEQAVAPVAGDIAGSMVTDEAVDSAVVHVLGPKGEVIRVYRVSLHADGWWPDGYSECA